MKNFVNLKAFIFSYLIIAALVGTGSSGAPTEDGRCTEENFPYLNE